jgi:hypothetical protein
MKRHCKKATAGRRTPKQEGGKDSLSFPNDFPAQRRHAFPNTILRYPVSGYGILVGLFVSYVALLVSPLSDKQKAGTLPQSSRPLGYARTTTLHATFPAMQCGAVPIFVGKSFLYEDR